LDAAVVEAGFEYFGGSACGGTVFAECTCFCNSFNIFDDSGDIETLTVDFGGVGVGFCGAVAGDAGGLGAAFTCGVELVVVLVIGFSATGGFADVGGAGFTTFGAAFVDFARVVAFFVPSDILISTGSEMTFLGLPLFFTASEDMLAAELGWVETLLREDSQRGNCEDQRGVILENLPARRQFRRVCPSLGLELDNAVRST
jgi:hypothetical protein